MTGTAELRFPRPWREQCTKTVVVELVSTLELGKDKLCRYQTREGMAVSGAAHRRRGRGPAHQRIQFGHHVGQAVEGQQWPNVGRPGQQILGGGQQPFRLEIARVEHVHQSMTAEDGGADQLFLAGQDAGHDERRVIVAKPLQLAP